MSENKPKKPVIGESKVMHVGPGFAIPVIVFFMIILLSFSVLWGGVLFADVAVNTVVNPIMLMIDPEAEPIDVMAIMSPPTSESNAAKTYAKFPTLDVKAIADPFKTAFDAFPGSTTETAKDVYVTIAGLAKSYYAISPLDFSALYNWYTTELPAATAAVSSEGAEISAWYETHLSPALSNATAVVSKTIDTYPAGIEAWYNDHLPFRSIIFNTNETVDAHIESPYSDVQNKLGEAANRFTNAMLVLRGEGTPSTGTPEAPGGEDLENPFDPDDPFIPDDPFKPNAPSDPDEPDNEPEETPPPFIEDTEDPGNGKDPSGEDPNGGDPNGGGISPGGNTSVCEHEYNEGEIETPATCTDWGVMKYTCTKCGKVKREYTQKASHDYVADAYTAPNCGEIRTVRSVCSYCKDEKISTIAKTHVKGKTIATVEPSYATYGFTLVECTDCGGQFRTDLKNKLYHTGFFLPTYHGGNQVIEGREKWLFNRLNNSEAYFTGTNLMSDAELQEYVSVMTTLDKLCKERGIQLQICIWPNKHQVYSEYLGLDKDVVTNNKRVDRLVEYVRANSEVKIIYPLKELKAAKPYADVYLKYDTHWNCAGGFVGYQAMLASLGLETTDFKNCTIYDSNYSSLKDPYYANIRGDLLGMGGWSAPASMYPNDHNYYIVYRPEVQVDTFSGTNGAGDTRHTTAANAPNDLNFVMLADSYRVMQLSYLERDFTDCFLTHRSHVNDADVKAAIKDADILVIAAVERLETDILGTARAIINILEEDAQ